MTMPKIYRVQIEQLPTIPNICQQILREGWKLGKKSSIAHVIMTPGNISLHHKHLTFTEVYYILEGTGKMWVGKETFNVKKDTLVEIRPNTPHKLKNTGNKNLTHLVISVPAFNPKDVILT